MSTLSRRDRTDATRQATETALLDATIALLGEGHAYADLGIEQIVRAAGFSRPTFYTYFRDKRELILRLGERLVGAVAAAGDPWLADAEGDIRPRLAGVLDAFRAHREILAALVEAAGYDPEVKAFWRGFHDRFLDTAAARIAERGVDKKHARARAYGLVWMTERTISEHLDHPTVDERALLDELTGFWEAAFTR
jgi:AcrR family transcriptional regulator